MLIKSIRLSVFFNNEISPFLLGAFLSQTSECENESEKYFYTYSTFKKSNVINSQFSFYEYVDKYITKLNQLSDYNNWSKHNVSDSSMTVRFYIRRDIEMSYYSFCTELSNKFIRTQTNNNETQELNEWEKNFIRGFFDLRGSIDTTAKYIAIDFILNKNDKTTRIDQQQTFLRFKEINTAFLILNIPSEYLNFNFRNLQPQYLTGESRRNPQIRIHSYYYAKKIGFVNEYKALLFEKNAKVHGHIDNGITYFSSIQLPQVTSRQGTNFIERINFFTSKIYSKNINNGDAMKFRQELGIDKTNISAPTNSRNTKLIKLFNDNEPDKCAVCGTEQTYPDPVTGRQKFEIHHVISFKNSYILGSMDCYDNLVKLCPTCHSKLGRGKAKKEVQIEAIKNILKNNPAARVFAEETLGITDLDLLAEGIWALLG